MRLSAIRGHLHPGIDASKAVDRIFSRSAARRSRAASIAGGRGTTFCPRVGNGGREATRKKVALRNPGASPGARTRTRGRGRRAVRANASASCADQRPGVCSAWARRAWAEQVQRLEGVLRSHGEIVADRTSATSRPSRPTSCRSENSAGIAGVVRRFALASTARRMPRRDRWGRGDRRYSSCGGRA